MTHGLRPYPEYKDSGRPWLEAIPSHWAMSRIKRFARVGNGSTPSRGKPEYWTENGLPWLNSGSVHQGKITRASRFVTSRALAECHLPQLEPGTVLVAITGQGKTRGTPGVLMIPATINQHMAYIAPRDGVVTGNFLRYSLVAAYAQLRAISDDAGGTKGALTCEDVRRFDVAVPPIEEQLTIAECLDQHEHIVRRFIRNRRHLIEVLNEQKHAIIDRAVTRGIDEIAPLKPSGIDRLGDIPEHWSVRRVRNVAELRVSNVDKHTKAGEQPVRLCNYTDVYKNATIRADMPFMAATATPEEVEAFRLSIGDVIITKDSEDWQDIGVPALVEETADDLVCGYHLAILRPTPTTMTGPFLAYALRSRFVVTQFSIAANGVTRYGLSHGAIKSITLPVPPILEQDGIVRHIDQATATLNHALRRATREIELIQEYRTRLIADVVTGKLDVRGFIPTEPMPADEAADEPTEEIGLEDEEAELVEEAVDAAD